MKKILITGGAGFIGSNLALKLISKGYHVRVLDNLSKQIHGDNPEITSPLFQSIQNKVDFIKGDVTCRFDMEKSLEGQDAIIHLAAETGTGQSMYEIKKYCDVNIGGTALLLDLLVNKKQSIKKLIVASSRAIYGEGKYRCNIHNEVYPEARNEIDMASNVFDCKCPICSGPLSLLPTSEDSKIHPTSVYGITKHSQEQMVLTVGKSLGISTIAFRYQNVYGPGQSLSNPYTGILSIFSTQIRNGNDVIIFEDGKESRDFVFIDDVVDATILGLENNEVKEGVFNVGLGLPVDVSTVATLLNKYYEGNVKIKITGNYRVGDIRHNYADLKKIKELLNYSPKYNFITGLSLFCDWVAKQDTLVDSYDKSIIELKKRNLFK